MANSSNNSIQIGGDVSGSMIVSGSHNVVTNQTTNTPTQSTANANKRKLLLLAANPKDATRLRLDEEIRDISEGLKRAANRDEFEISQRWAVRARDLQRAIQEESPQIVHFTGQSEGLMVEDATGTGKAIGANALSALFQLFAQKVQIECVVLNRCYSPAQAAAIAQHIPFVIGVSPDTAEQAAIEFVVGFYDALGSGESIQFAFDSGKVALALSGEDDAASPVLLTQPAL